MDINGFNGIKIFLKKINKTCPFISIFFHKTIHCKLIKLIKILLLLIKFFFRLDYYQFNIIIFQIIHFDPARSPRSLRRD